MRASVVIATFNGERYLNDQLHSISTQTVAPYEVVVSDDGSTDRTTDMVRDWARIQSFPVLVTRNPDARGYNSNFSYGFSRASGDLIFPCDQDDVWYPHKLQAMLSAARENLDVMLFICDAELSTFDGLSTGLSRIGQAQSGRFSLSNYVQGACSAFRREFSEFIIPIPSAWAYDSWLHEVARRLGVRMILPVTLQSFRRHSDNATASPTSSLEPASYLLRVRSAIRRGRMKGRLATVKVHEEMHGQLVEVIGALKSSDAHLGFTPSHRTVASAYETCLAESKLLSLRIAYLERPRSQRLQAAVAATFEMRGLRVSSWPEILKDMLFR